MEIKRLTCLTKKNLTSGIFFLKKFKEIPLCLALIGAVGLAVYFFRKYYWGSKTVTHTPTPRSLQGQQDGMIRNANVTSTVAQGADLTSSSSSADLSSSSEEEATPQQTAPPTNTAAIIDDQDSVNSNIQKAYEYEALLLAFLHTTSIEGLTYSNEKTSFVLNKNKGTSETYSISQNITIGSTTYSLPELINKVQVHLDSLWSISPWTKAKNAHNNRHSVAMAQFNPNIQTSSKIKLNQQVIEVMLKKIDNPSSSNNSSTSPSTANNTSVGPTTSISLDFT